MGEKRCFTWLSNAYLRGDRTGKGKRRIIGYVFEFTKSCSKSQRYLCPRLRYGI